MNILVCVKQVPDNAVLPKLDSAGHVVTDGVETMISPFDQNAVEACKSVLKIGLAMGAEKAYLVNDPALEGSDPWATSYALAKAIKSIGEFDLILCGKQAIDGDNAQVGGGIAQQLDIPQVSNICEIVESGDAAIKVKRVSPAGEEVVEAKLPALLTCEKSLNEPRYPTLKRTRLANRVEIPVLDCAAIGADAAKVGAGSPNKVQKLYTPAPRQAGELIKGEAGEIGKLAVQKIIDLKVV